LGAFTALAAFSATSKSVEPSLTAPAEVASAGPQGTRLIAFKTSGHQPNADAMAVFETPVDKDGVAHRDLVIFGKKDGKFIPEVTSDKLIACSKCSQFHDDPFAYANIKVTQGHIHLDQMDGGEQPSTTTMDFVRKDSRWVVMTATRISVDEGRYDAKTEKLPIPASGLVMDMDGAWSVPAYFNALAVDSKSNQFIFLHGDGSREALQGSVRSECKDGDCKVLVEQQDGCISLVQDGGGHSFGAGIPDAGKKDVAIAAAMAACGHAGGNQCKPVRTDCSTGVRNKLH
jgi:hypothetical protein